MSSDSEKLIIDNNVESSKNNKNNNNISYELFKDYILAKKDFEIIQDEFKSKMIFILSCVFFSFGLIITSKITIISLVFSFILSVFSASVVSNVVDLINNKLCLLFDRNKKNIYDKLKYERQKVINLLKDIKIQKKLLDFMDWKRRNHFISLFKRSMDGNSIYDYQKLIIIAFSSKDYHKAFILLEELYYEFNNNHVYDPNLNNYLELLEEKEEMTNIKRLKEYL